MSTEASTQRRGDLCAEPPALGTNDGSSGTRSRGDPGIAEGVAPAPPAARTSDHTDLSRLRGLLLGMDYEQLAAMRDDVERMRLFERELRNRAGQTDLVASVLSEAMLIRENQDRGISRALQPAISDAIRAAVRNDPQPVVEAVSPVIGPSIRRAVHDAITGMLELLEKLLEHNLSWQALQWRIEAWRSGRRYSEIVLLRTLVYRVEQALLIHRKTGLLLQHAQSPQAGFKDPDLVGSMLTAITDFVSDSFSVPDETAVRTMQVGDYKVLVEEGRLAILAAIVRGNPPSELARTLRDTLETIEALYRERLAQFDGDAKPLEETHGLLETCLKSQQRPPMRRRPWLVPALAVSLVLAPLAYWGHSAYQAQRLWSAALGALRAEPGIVITEAAREGDVYRVSGLRDPLARQPAEVIGPQARSNLRWEWHWRPFLSIEPAFLLDRARQALQPPPTVTLALDGGLLEVSGEASREWIDTMSRVAPRIPGVTSYRDVGLAAIDDRGEMPEAAAAALSALSAEPGIVVTGSRFEGERVHVRGLRDPLARDPHEVIGPQALSAVQWAWQWRPFLSAESDFILARARQALQPPATVALSLDDGVLTVSGEASREWVDAVQGAALQVPGITGYRDDTLRVTDDQARRRHALADHRVDIEETILYFEVDATRLAPEQAARLDTLAEAMKALEPLASALGLTPRYLATGYADATGSRARNRLLSFSRAEGVVEELVARGVNERLFLPLKMGVSMPNADAPAAEDRAQNRRVTLDVILLEHGGEVAK